MQPFGTGNNTSNIPAFLGKLWKMVNDPNTDHLICWSVAGNSFVIQNQAQFWYELLPLYYKHNNMSSFVRQLNMYGFHKMSTVENGTMDADKDEIQFYHRYFQKDQPELLRNIKRKVTVSKSEHNIQNVMGHEDIAKVLTDVKHLRGRQSSVDSQLSAMKQENAVLWRELAMLRQKHIKQQQIVNKLIQFLVTLVQPSPASRMGVGVKRRMPLMLHGSPNKRSKTKKPVKSETVDNGPIIHELDSELEISPDELFETDIEEGLVSSPHTSSTSPLSNPPASVSSSSEASGDSTLPDNFWDKPDFVVMPNIQQPLEKNNKEKEVNHLQPEDLMANDVTEDGLNDLQNTTRQSNEKVFLNPHSRDTLLTNLVNGNYNSKVNFSKNSKKTPTEQCSSNNLLPNSTPDLNQDMTVATKEMRINSGEDFDLHLESAQSEIEQLKDILHGCGSLDANTLLGLFNEETPGSGLNFNHTEVSTDNATLHAADPMVSGTELVTSSNNLIDFNELFDDSLTNQDGSNTSGDSGGSYSGEMNLQSKSGMVVKSEPVFQCFDKDL